MVAFLIDKKISMHNYMAEYSNGRFKRHKSTLATQTCFQIEKPPKMPPIQIPPSTKYTNTEQANIFAERLE